MARMMSQTQLLSNSWQKQLLFIVVLRVELKGDALLLPVYAWGVGVCRFSSEKIFWREKGFFFSRTLDKRCFFAYNEGIDFMLDVGR